jgi:predicted TPR repeat methyltransferase
MNYLQEFKHIYETKLWGEESPSGNGFKSEVDSKVISIIEEVINKYEIKSILDLGCGDWTIMKNVDLSSVDRYVGMDCVEALIEENINNYSTDKVSFKYDDARTTDLEDFDLIIVRDVLIHYPNESIKIMLDAIKNKKYSYLLMTTWQDGDNSEKFDRFSNARKVNFFADPFNLSQPDEVFYEDEGQNKQLSIWKK